MTLSQHYRAAQALSPKAAKAAARLLDGSVGIPFEWRLSLRMVLVERSHGAAPFTTSELAPLATRAASGGRPIEGDALPLDQARRFIQSVRDDALALPP
jgi:hypothetical protein